MSRAAKPKERKHRIITVRMEKSLAEKIEHMAEKNYRTVSQEVRRMCLLGSRRPAK
jgi:hypothetical protein